MTSDSTEQIAPSIILQIPVQMSPRSPMECDYTNDVNMLPSKKVSFGPPEADDAIASRLEASTQIEEQQQDNKTGSKVNSLAATNEKRRKICWCKRVRIKEIRHLNDISESEKDSLWMSLADYQMTKTMVKTTVMMMMKGEQISEDDTDFCTRGLEFRTKAGSKIRGRYKLRTRSAVLNEQDLQRDEGFFDPQFIAMASMEESVECRDGARQRALHDERSIQQYLNDIRVGIQGFMYK